MRSRGGIQSYFRQRGDVEDIANASMQAAEERSINGPRGRDCEGSADRNHGDGECTQVGRSARTIASTHAPVEGAIEAVYPDEKCSCTGGSPVLSSSHSDNVKGGFCKEHIASITESPYQERSEGRSDKYIRRQVQPRGRHGCDRSGSSTRDLGGTPSNRQRLYEP